MEVTVTICTPRTVKEMKPIGNFQWMWWRCKRQENRTALPALTGLVKRMFGASEEMQQPWPFPPLTLPRSTPPQSSSSFSLLGIPSMFYS